MASACCGGARILVWFPRAAAGRAIDRLLAELTVPRGAR